MSTETDWGGAPSVLRMILGKQLEELRTQAGLTYSRRAKAIGVSHSTIRRMEAAKVAAPGSPTPRSFPPDVRRDRPQEIDTFLKSVPRPTSAGWSAHTYRDVLPDWFRRVSEP